MPELSVTQEATTLISNESLTPILEKKARESGLQFEAFEYDPAHGLLQGAVAAEVQAQIIEILKGAGSEK